MKVLGDKIKLLIIFINQSFEKTSAYYHSRLCSTGVDIYVVDFKDTSKVRLLQFIQSLFICTNN